MEAEDPFSQQAILLQWGIVSLSPNPEARGPPPFGCPRLIMKYIRSYPPHVKAVSSIRNLWWRGPK
jgi:hypothetical protein